MDISRCIEKEINESHKLEYKDKEVDNADIVKELVAFCNSSGGTVILGVREESGEIQKVQDITDYAEREETINQLISSHVDPPIQVEYEDHNINNKKVCSITVEETNTVNSFSEDSPPIYPRRQGSTTDYMSGGEIRARMNLSSPDEKAEENSPISEPKQDDIEIIDEPETYFTPIPRGYINRVCTFSPVYWPSSPYSATIHFGSQTDEKIKDIFNTLISSFEFDDKYSWFTIHQQTGAWFGRGINDYLSALIQEDYRIQQVPAEYSLTTYKNAIGVLVGSISAPYPNSNIIIHAEPWHGSNGFRDMTVEMIFDGIPLDKRPIEDFLNEVEPGMTNAQKRKITTESYPGINKLTVEPVSFIEESFRGSFISDAVCKNPFLNQGESLSTHLDLTNTGGLDEYQYIPGHLRDYHPRNEDKQYEVIGYKVTKFNEIGGSIPVTLHNVDFSINW